PGTAVITANQSGNKNYLPANPVSQTLVVGKAMQTIVWSEIPGKYYGDPDFALPKTTDKGLTISYVSDNEAVATVNENIVHITGTGSANITASQAGDDFYHEAASVTLTLTVSKSYQNITFNELPTCTYGDPAIELGAYTNSSSSVRYESSDTEVATVSGSTLTIVGAGSCYITAYAGSDDNYYEGTPVQRQLIVNKADQTIEFPAIADKVYGDMPFTLSAVSSRNLPITYTSSDPSRISITGATATINGAGSVTVTATQEGTRNYNGATAQIQVNVNKAVLTASAVDVTREYGEPNPDLAVDYTGFKNGDTALDLSDVPTATCAATRYSNVGTYDIIVSEITDGNYSLMYQKGTLTVTKAQLTVIANDAAKIYGDKNPTLTISYSGFKNNQTDSELLNKPTVSTTAKTMSDAGEYPIIVEGGNARNYEIVYREGTLTISKATLTVTLDNAEREYGSYVEYVLNYSGFKGNDTKNDLDVLPSVVTNADIESPAGRYAIMLEGGSDNNYAYSFRYQEYPYTSNGIIIITKAPLTIIADDKYKGYLESMPQLTMSFLGLRNGDTADDLDQWPYINCNANANSSRGQYDITLSGGYDNNYDYILQDGTLTIGNDPGSSVLANSIIIEPNYVTMMPGDVSELAVSILPDNVTDKTIVWRSSDTYVATVSSGTVTALNIGQATISAATTDGSNLTAYCLINVTASGIDEIETQAVTMWVHNKQIFIKNAPMACDIKIYSASGTIAASRHVTEDITVCEVFCNGMYIVNINGHNYKIIVR
ncbi:MAG: Ig-like domain-containing protein, partial [Muribaculaceae bacterium]|nr:Ig-like domain-containing protein [Muribaculaceae bacterium]